MAILSLLSNLNGPFSVLMTGKSISDDAVFLLPTRLINE